MGIKVGKIKDYLDYKTGVKQGDDLAPILFIIVMQFISELIPKTIDEANISPISFFSTTPTRFIKENNSSETKGKES